MKEKVSQLFRDKSVLVMLVLGLLTIVAAAGAVTIRRNGQAEESPYIEIRESEGIIADETAQQLMAEGSSDAAMPAEAAEEETKEETPRPADQETAAREDIAEAETGREAKEAGAVANESLVLDFTADDRLAWPVEGSVLLSYSMDTTTWFPTLEQYKCNPATVIQSDVSTPVTAPADARVIGLGSNEEIGSYLRLDLGNGYTALCGQLKEIPVVENEYLHKGDVLGYIAEPTKYYSVEGNNLYFEFFYENEPVDALDYLE